MIQIGASDAFQPLNPLRTVTGVAQRCAASEDGAAGTTSWLENVETPMLVIYLRVGQASMDRIHQGLRTELLGSASAADVLFTEAMVTHGKQDLVRGLHCVKRTFTLSGGLTAEDMLGWLGFARGRCPVIGEREAFCIAAPGADLETFAATFGQAAAVAISADRELQECGFFLESREFPAKHWIEKFGDGHTGEAHERLKDVEDEHFRYLLTWMKSGGDGGWTMHYLPKGPLSPGVERGLAKLGLRRCDQCIEVDFNPCYWRRVRRVTAGGDRFFGGNNHSVHKWFDEHPARFAAGIDRLVRAHELMTTVGLDLLPQKDRTGLSQPPGKALGTR